VEGGTPPISVSFNGEQTEQSVFPNLSAGSYTLEFIDQNGCEFDTTVVLVDPDPLTVDLGANLTIAPGEEVVIEANVNIDPDQIQSIFWTINGELACDPCEELQLPFTGENNATVEITVIDINGCEASDRLQINIIVERNVYIPNAFSPNEDGINDRFLVYGDEFVEEVEEIMIFDRWGTKVFERRNIPLNDPDFGWNGIYRDSKLNPAVFVYYIRVRFTDGVTEDFSGDLILVE
nr:gliding motility-associated C-terminal domain-containing protein [Saprospiraceae bacterium]